MHQDTRDLRDRQYQAWGAIVRNARVAAVHIANGVMQLMRLYPSLLSAPLRGVTAREEDFPSAHVAEVKARLDALYRGREPTWSLPARAVGFCVTSSKSSGPLGLTPSEHETATDREVMTPAREHAQRLFVAPPGERAHALIAGALNADRRVYVSSNADDPTTPGVHFAGYSNNYTLDLMFSSTLLGLLAATVRGRAILRDLYALLIDDAGPHDELLGLLELKNSPPERALPPAGDDPVTFPLPPGEGWAELAEVTARAYERLLSWAPRGGARADTLMAISDLAGLLLSGRFLRWASAPPLLMAAPLTPRQRDAALIIAAQRSFQSVSARINAEAQERDLIEVKITKKGSRRPLRPQPIYRNLLQATGWLFPRYAQGGARQHLCPGPRQLMTLTRALLSAGDDISWGELRHRARALSIELGGPPVGAPSDEYPALLVSQAGDMHKEHLVALGLARQESDNVVRVDGGWT